MPSFSRSLFDCTDFYDSIEVRFLKLGFSEIRAVCTRSLMLVICLISFRSIGFLGRKFSNLTGSSIGSKTGVWVTVFGDNLAAEVGSDGWTVAWRMLR